MMGERSAQDRLFAADHIYLDYVGRETLYGYLAQHRGQLFRDEDFAILYCRNNGRPSVPPSVAVSILFLRAYDSVSFVEAIERTKYDLRWKVCPVPPDSEQERTVFELDLSRAEESER